VLRYKARRALDRLLAVARGGRNRRTDVRFAAALRATDAG
jgi:hypothetical protein